jgi:ATP-binding cassette subfamily E protein 1
MRIAVIDREKCKPEKCGFTCGKVCPKNRMGEKCITLEEHVEIDEGLCIGCGICVKKCPFEAIQIVNTPEALEESPIHRFGKNGFVLFRLPFPVEGEVVGLLGKNGLGKTTALKILAGQLKPNFGEETSENWLEKLEKIFRGTELQKYLEKLEKGEVKTVTKPQQIDFLASLDSSAKELFENDELGKKEELIEMLQLREFLEKPLSKLSGGELQRVAIAIACMRKADLYLFDEPSSYLDVSQRLNVAKAIREVAKNASVIVVEHDLATLDLVADKIHVFYGVPGAFGIVSKPYSTKNGINAFLEGYIKEDNVRIHEPIKFVKVARAEAQKETMVKFSELKKSYDSFSLWVEGGEIRKGEILGMFGQNGLGKTTFAKILAGIEKAYRGEIEKTVKISYKPQYLQEKFKELRDFTVEQVLSKLTNVHSETFRKTFLRPLELEHLLQNTISSLSGGELQRLAIAICLSQEAELYLLDEPSAFLDVTQRMNLIKLLQRFSEEREVAIAIIDHDLVLLNVLCERCLLFRGIPSKEGKAKFYSVEEGLNEFLKDLDITFRKDAETGRPRANKPGSQKDEEQKKMGKYFLG